MSEPKQNRVPLGQLKNKDARRENLRAALVQKPPLTPPLVVHSVTHTPPSGSARGGLTAGSPLRRPHKRLRLRKHLLCMEGRKHSASQDQYRRSGRRWLSDLTLRRETETLRGQDGKTRGFRPREGERTSNRGKVARPGQDEVQARAGGRQQIKIKIRASPTNSAILSRTNEVLMFWTIKATKKKNEKGALTGVAQ